MIMEILLWRGGKQCKFLKFFIFKSQFVFLMMFFQAQISCGIAVNV